MRRSVQSANPELSTLNSVALSDSHVVLEQHSIQPIAQLVLQEPKDDFHRAFDILEHSLALLAGQIRRRTSTKERFEHHIVRKRDRLINRVDVQEIGDKALLSEYVRDNVRQRSSERLQGRLLSTKHMR